MTTEGSPDFAAVEVFSGTPKDWATRNPSAPATTETGLASQEGIAGVQARAMADIQMRVALARNRPRYELDVYNRVMASCQRLSFAEAALYRYPRGGVTIEGPTIKMALEIGRMWGNLDVGYRIVQDNGNQVTVQGYAFDLETNFMATNEISAELKYARKDKNTGKSVWVAPTDPRDRRQLIGSLGSIVKRNSILEVVPRDIVDDAKVACKATLRSGGGLTLIDRIRRMTAKFREFGVTQEMLERVLTHGLDTATGEELTELVSIYNSVSSSEAKFESFYPETPKSWEANRKGPNLGALPTGAPGPEKTEQAEETPPSAATPPPEKSPEATQGAAQAREVEKYKEFKTLKKPGFEEWLLNNVDNRASWTLYVTDKVEEKCKTIFGNSLEEYLQEWSRFIKGSSTQPPVPPAAEMTLERKIDRIDDILTHVYSVAAETIQEWMQASWDCDLLEGRVKITDKIAEAILADLSDPTNSTLTSFIGS